MGTYYLDEGIIGYKPEHGKDGLFTAKLNLSDIEHVDQVQGSDRKVSFYQELASTHQWDKIFKG